MTLRHVTLDCEFVPKNLTPQGLVSIGMTDGVYSFYGVNAEMDFEAATAWKFPWMNDNVIRHLPLKDGALNLDHADVYSYDALRHHVEQFFLLGGHRRNQKVYMNCGAQDMVRLHTLVCDNDWDLMPDSIPKRFKDMGEVFEERGVNEDDLPRIDPDLAHHAYHDAAHDLELLRHLKVVG